MIYFLTEYQLSKSIPFDSRIITQAQKAARQSLKTAGCFFVRKNYLPICFSYGIPVIGGKM